MSSDHIPTEKTSSAATDIAAASSKFSSISVTESSSRARKPSFSFMENRLNHRLIIDDIDVTPDNITDARYVTMEDVFTHAAFEKKAIKTQTSSKMLKDSEKSKTGDMGMKVYATTINLDDIHIDHTINTEEGYVPDDADLDAAPSAFYLPKAFPPMSYPRNFFVCLKETDTLFLFELPCYSLEKGSAAGNAAEEENEYYAYITVGKGRNRKMVNQETQTKSTVTQTRHTTATRPQKKNASCFASLWDMHDTYAKLAQREEEEVEDEMVMYQSASPHLLRKKRLKTKKEHRDNLDFMEIGKTAQFFDAALLVERVLAAKDYSQEQKRYRGLVRSDPLSLDLIYIYSMRPLWMFECPETAGIPITSISFNPKNPNILAVAHGKFVYADKYGGIVCVWCTKNPCLPERLYRFTTPVSAVSFSVKNPNWLACGFANGDVSILDITSYPIKMIAQSKRDTNPSFEPIWVIKWHNTEQGDEYVMTAGQDGRISRFQSTKTHDFICTPMMRISAVEGKMKGLETTKSCQKVDVPITRYPAALTIIWHPSVGHQYLVGSDEGCIHKCSSHYLNQHIDVYKAHTGPIYALEYSPFMSNLLVSCGADCAIRLWLEGLDDVIMTLTCASAVYGVSFCPINATILLSVSGNILSIWDMRRKTHMPCAEFTFPASVVLTYIKFTDSGDNVFVGDSTGKVHTFHLEDTPIPPYYQCKMLDEALKKALCTRPHLLKQMEKLEKFRDKFK